MQHYKVCIVTKVFLVIASVDYTESFSPVVTEVGVQTIIDSSLHFINKNVVQNILAADHWVLEVYSIEAAFLNADPGTKMYIKILDKMVELEFITKEEQQET